MIRTLRKKFILINMMFVFLVLFTVFLTLCAASYNRLEAENQMMLEAVLSRREGQKQPLLEIGQKPPPDFMRAPVFSVSADRHGNIKLIMSDNISISQELLEEVAAQAAASGQAGGMIEKYNLRYMKRTEPYGLKIAFIDVSGNAAAMRNTVLSSVIVCIAALAAFFVVSLFLSKWALLPVEQAWIQQRQFVADASHELKTPLTVILANTGILKSNRAHTIESQINWVENTEDEAGRMKKLVDSLLFLAKTDAAGTPMVCGLINLSDAVTGVALAFESVAYERGVSIDTDGITPGVYVSGDGEGLAQLAGILIDNAVKYAPDGGTVTLLLAEKQEKAVFSVHNTGSYLEPEDLAHVFDRFYRADKARANDGYGLGLSIARRIAERHNGKISAESAKTSGTSFTVALPLESRARQ